MYPPVEKSPRLTATQGLHHGFFGRQGGVSDGDFSSLNTAVAVGDDRANTEENIRRAVMALKSGPVPVALIKQVHGTRVHVATEATIPGDRPEADAVVTDRAGIAVGVVTADCAPILLADPVAGVVAAAHAGWRGALGGVLENTLATMAELGATPANIVGAIGPAISARHYEVGDDFVAMLQQEHPEALCCLVSIPGETHPHFDLVGMVQHRAQALGLAPLEIVGDCTYANPERYFSHRFATHRHTRTGRQISLIVKS